MSEKQNNPCEIYMYNTVFPLLSGTTRFVTQHCQQSELHVQYQRGAGRHLCVCARTVGDMQGLWLPLHPYLSSSALPEMSCQILYKILIVTTIYHCIGYTVFTNIVIHNMCFS